MLARLSRTCSQLADLRWGVASPGLGRADEQVAAYSSYDLLPPEVNMLSELSISVPENAFENVVDAAGTCKKMLSPFYEYVGSTLSTDIEKVVKSLHEADPEFVDELDSDSDEEIYVIPFPPLDTPASSPEGSTASCAENSSSLPSSGSVSDSPVPQRNTCIPRIVITPAPLQCREMSSCVPVQDTSFGARLTVPSHFALNAAHPPMTAPSYTLAPMHKTVRSWTYRQGHWCAVAPSLHEQEHRGIFSRPINTRRRASRKKAGRVPVSHAYHHQNAFVRNKRES